MKVLLGTNLLVAYLLIPDKTGTVQAIVEAAFEGKYTLILPQELLDELEEKLVTKKYLIKHISKSAARDFIRVVKSIVVEIPTITEPIPEVGRDKKDDYLLAYAVVGEADYLVSGDKDLQVLKKIGGVEVVSPAKFLEVLEK